MRKLRTITQFKPNLKKSGEMGKNPDKLQTGTHSDLFK